MKRDFYWNNFYLIHYNKFLKHIIHTNVFKKKSNNQIRIDGFQIAEKNVDWTLWDSGSRENGRRRSKRKYCWQLLRRVIGQFRSLQLTSVVEATPSRASLLLSSLRRGSPVYNFDVYSTTKEDFSPQTWTINRSFRHVSFTERSYSNSFICLASGHAIFVSV